VHTSIISERIKIHIHDYVYADTLLKWLAKLQIALKAALFIANRAATVEFLVAKIVESRNR